MLLIPALNASQRHLYLGRNYNRLNLPPLPDVLALGKRRVMASSATLISMSDSFHWFKGQLTLRFRELSGRGSSMPVGKEFLWAMPLLPLVTSPESCMLVRPPDRLALVVEGDTMHPVNLSVSLHITRSIETRASRCIGCRR